MVKILITGFRHSGTTMLMALIRAHPQVGWIEFEESYIEFDKPKDWILMHASRQVPNLKKYAWGEKIPWAAREDDVKGKRAIKMIKKWLKFFKGEARVLHILRHPFDVAMSGVGLIAEEDWKFISTTVPLVIDFMNKSSRCGTIVYEDLVTSPQIHLRNIFKFLNLNSSPKVVQKVINTPLIKYRKINSDRAFAFRSKKINKKFDYDKLIERVKNRL
jgi:hypothetical protein